MRNSNFGANHNSRHHGRRSGYNRRRFRQRGWLFSVRQLLSIGSGNDNAQPHCAREGHFCRRSSSVFFNTIEPETVIRWHRAGFRLFWRWKLRCRVGRPKVALEIRQLIREMSLVNPLWGAPRIHGELLKLGIDVGQTSVAKYMARRRRPPSRDGRRSCATMPMESHRSICLSFRQSPSDCCTPF